MKKIYNWGIYPKIEATEIKLSHYFDIAEMVKKTKILIPRGNGRCYGDSSLQKTIFSTSHLNRFIFLDKKNAKLKCESGVLLSNILEIIVPNKLFLPVTPGTKFITIGGAVASNIHGKNHHSEGAISQYIESFEILNDDGEIILCSRKLNSKLFKNTIGAMGLTGIILTVELQLKRIETSYIKQKSIKTKNIHEILDYMDQYKDYTYSVAWIDCLEKKNLGRSILMLGEHAKYKELNKKQKNNHLLIHSKKQINIPFMFPSFFLNKFFIPLLNKLYYHKQFKKEVNNIIHYNSYFYPLDSINNWNRIYGKKGFLQYQFVIPFKDGKKGLIKILTKIVLSHNASFLAVLKTLGKSDHFSSPISFPSQGFTLSLDFKINKNTFKLLNELDEIVINHGGRTYLAKDARMKQNTFHKMYKKKLRHPQKFNSLQSNRLEI